MAENNRKIILTAVVACLGITIQTSAQEFELDDRVPEEDCPNCIGVATAGVITAVRDIEIPDNASESVLRPGEFDDDVSLFLDRIDDATGESRHRTDVVPNQLRGADYVEMSQNNADWVTFNDVEIDIEIDVIPGGIVYLLIDTPEITRNGGFVPFHWMEDTDQWDGLQFFDTGSSTWGHGFLGDTFPEFGDERQLYIYGVGPLKGGTYHLGEQDVDSTFYSVVALAGETDPLAPLNDGSLTGDARVAYVHDELGTWMGDSNVDGEFNSGDLVVVFGAGKYETGEAATWETGDWDGDMLFDSGDLVAAFADGGYEAGIRPAPAAVPEPTGILLLGCGVGCALGQLRRRR